MSAATFPAGSARAAVAAFGDAWHAAFITPDFDCPPARDCLTEEHAFELCDTLSDCGRRWSVPRRAFLGLQPHEVAA